MGLSGRKAKQRIGKDPRNLSWADDASRFGQTYLAKFGWDASKGLGTSGEGRMTAIKATQKLDMLGIGMQHQKDPNGIAWRQQQDFENLLRRLNDGTDAPAGPFCKARAEEEESGEEGSLLEERGEEKSTSETQKMDEDEGEGIVKKKEKKKKKRKNAEEPDEVTHDKKRRKKRKRSKEDDDDGHAAPDAESEPLPLPPPEAAPAPIATVIAPKPVPIRAPPRTHRARMIAAKRMALSNSTALAEILGIPSSSTSSFTSPYMSTAATPTPTPAPGPGRGPAVESQEPLQQLTTSSQSVGDYFKAKLSTKRQSHPTLATADPPPVSAPPSSSWDGDDDGNRAGLGSGGGASRVLLMNSLDEGRVRGGIGASSSKFAAMFTLPRPMTYTQEKNAMPAIEPVETHDAADLDDDRRKSDKKLAKEERRRKKEEKRRRRAGAGQVDDTATDMPIDETPVGQAKKKKRHERGSEDTQTADVVGVEAIREKRREKYKKSSKCRRPKE